MESLDRLSKRRKFLVAGVMSGTSCDGVSMALLEVSRRGERLGARCVAHGVKPYSRQLRRRLLDAATLEVADLATLHVELGSRLGDVVKAVAGDAPLQLVGSHGHTLFHRSRRGGGRRRAAVSWQIGEPAEIAARCGCPVVADFRPSDVAQAGEGAPLVPFGDAILFRPRRRPRVCLNIGGIANITLLDASAGAVLAFDTGPGGTLLDLAARRVSAGARSFDRGGRLAARGAVHGDILERLLAHGYFRRRPPKSTGRELFGEAFLDAALRGRQISSADLLATLTELTVETIGRAVESLPLDPADIVVAGGGAHNRTLLARLAKRLSPRPIVRSDDLGWPIESREAAAFALLAAAFVWGIPASVPACTGGTRPVVLGKLCVPP